MADDKVLFLGRFPKTVGGKVVLLAAVRDHLSGAMPIPRDEAGAWDRIAEAVERDCRRISGGDTP